jgi:hypothetical protein
MTWTHHSSDSEGIPPPVHPRQSTSDQRELDGINTCLGELEICIAAIVHELQHAAETTTGSTGGILTVYGIQSWTIGLELAWKRTPQRYLVSFSYF